jgi:hypothetical protein
MNFLKSETTVLDLRISPVKTITTIKEKGDGGISLALHCKHRYRILLIYVCEADA